MHKPLQDYIHDVYGLKAIMDTVAFSAVKATYWESRGRPITDEGVGLRELFRNARNDMINGMWAEKQPLGHEYPTKKIRDAISYYDTEKPITDAEDDALIDIKKAFEGSGVEDLIAHAKAVLAASRVPFGQFETEIRKQLESHPIFDWANSIALVSPATKLKMMLSVGGSLAMACAITSNAQLQYMQQYNQNAYGKMIKSAEELKLLREDVREYHESHAMEIGEAVMMGWMPQFEIERLMNFLATPDAPKTEEATA